MPNLHSFFCFEIILLYATLAYFLLKLGMLFEAIQKKSWQLWQYDTDSKSEQLLPERRPEAHVLGPPDGQPVPGVVVHHLRDGDEAALEVAQLELPGGRVAPDAHVHEALGAPVERIRRVISPYEFPVTHTAFSQTLVNDY